MSANDEKNKAHATTSSDLAADTIAHDASRAEDVEHEMTIAQAFKLYPKAVGWSILLSTAVIMEGYDTMLVGNFYSQPAFQKAFGIPDGKGGYQIRSIWQSGLSNASAVGCILGLFFAGTSAERFGYRKTMIGALTLITGSIFVVFFADSLKMLLAGEILCGLSWGIFQTVTMVSPFLARTEPDTDARTDLCVGSLPCLSEMLLDHLCEPIGQFIAAIILKVVANMEGKWAYKIPFAIQWIWPVPLIIGISFAPESPWWLIRKGRNEEARKALIRLTSPEKLPSFDADESISMMIYTTELEKSQQAGTSYWDCFKGADLRRTEVVCAVYAVQSLCGSTLMGYSVYFMEQAGFSVSNAFAMSIGQYGMGAVGTVSSWFLMSHFGRRTLYTYGTALLAVLLLIIGCLGTMSADNTNAQWGIGVLLLVYTFFYDATVGPLCYSLVPELSSTRLRNKSVVLARNGYNILGIGINFLTPAMLNPTAWNWGAKAAFFWTGSCSLCALYMYFRLPEPKGRTYSELDVLFRNGTPARKFKNTVVNPFEYADDIKEGLVTEKRESALHVESVGN